MSALAVIVSNIKPFPKNTLVGFFDIEFADTGMILRECTFHLRDGKRWIGWPARPYTKQDGTKSLANIVNFRDNKAKYLMQDEVLPIVIAAFADGGR